MVELTADQIEEIDARAERLAEECDEDQLRLALMAAYAGLGRVSAELDHLRLAYATVCDYAENRDPIEAQLRDLRACAAACNCCGLHWPCPLTAVLSFGDTPKPGCADHKPVQHRDGKPPWCPHCGLTATFTVPVSSIGRRVVGAVDEENGHG